jgi:hypothetical protein
MQSKSDAIVEALKNAETRQNVTEAFRQVDDDVLQDMDLIIRSILIERKNKTKPVPNNLVILKDWRKK